MKKLNFQVKFKAKVNGKLIEGIETEASWFLIDQRGNFYSHAPMRPIESCEQVYEYIEPLIKINDEYLSISEIEKRLSD